MEQQKKVVQIKEIVRKVFPLLTVDTVYDGQTTVNALAGLIAGEIDKKVASIKLSEIMIDLSEEKDSKIKYSMVEILNHFQEESAQELSETLERLGDTLQAYGAHTFLKQPMDSIKLSDILSE